MRQRDTHFEEIQFSPKGGNPLRIVRNKASFVASGKNLGRRESGCGNAFIPFSSLDAEETAIQAIRCGLGIILGKETGNPVISRKEDAEAFLEKGFILL